MLQWSSIVRCDQKKESLYRSCEAGVTSKQRKANQNTRNKSWNATVDGSESRATLSYTQKLTKRRGRAGPDAFYLGKTRPATTSGGPWLHPPFLRLNLVNGRLHMPFELDDQIKKRGRSPMSELLDAYWDGDGAVEEHTAREETRSEEDREKPAAASLTIFDHLYFPFLFTFLLLGFFFT